jgi:hypothetical protein
MHLVDDGQLHRACIEDPVNIRIVRQTNLPTETALRIGKSYIASRLNSVEDDVCASDWNELQKSLSNVWLHFSRCFQEILQKI